MNFVTKASSTGTNMNVKSQTPALLKDQPQRVDPSEIGKIYNRSPEELLNLQELPYVKIDQNLFSNQSGYRGVLPREPTPFSYVYIRPPKDDIMAGYQAPAPNARAQKPGPLMDVPILKKLAPDYGSYQ
tara:strand:+ start:1192 stop:1578 length:387 start_codon:yes stop_codon:yes gene_type:complete